MYIVISKDALLSSDQPGNIEGVPLWTTSLDDNIVSESKQYVVRVVDENESQFREFIKYTEDQIKSFKASKAVVAEKIDPYYKREPFASKTLADGSKLYRRKHGQKVLMPASSETEIIFTAPYAHSKINKLEVIDANALDRLDLYVKSPVDPAVAALYGMPADYMLNQFAFDVIVSSLLYSDKSDYDADIYAGFQVVAKYKNDTAEDKMVGFNLIYHEVK